jgi:hypothetical protein
MPSMVIRNVLSASQFKQMALILIGGQNPT